MNEAGIINISGISESRCAPVISHIVKEERQSIVITASAGRAERLASDLSFFSRKEILVMPAEEQVFLRYEVKSQERLIGRLKALKELRAGKECVVVAPVSAVLKKMPPHRVFDSLSLKIASGGETDPATLRETLVKLGYERTDMVEGPGQFSVRGGIIDVFAPGSDDPYRIELFDTKVDSLRLLDRNTQRSARNLTYIEIPPAEHMPADKEVFQQAGKRLYREYTARIKALAKKGGEFSETASRLEKRRDELCEYIGGMTNLQVLENYLRYFYEDTEYLWDYMDGGKVIVDDPERICEFLDTMGAEIRNDFEAMLERGEVIPKDIGIFPGSEDFFRVYGRRGVYVLTPFTKRIKGADTLAGAYAVRSRQMVAFNGKMDILESELKNYAKKNYKITIIASAKEKLDNLREFVGRAGICGNILFKEGALTEGMDFPDEKVCYICENDIFPGQKIARRRRKKTAPGKMKPFADISKGDYVVHENHGIGRFLGIEPLTVQGEKKDYLKIKYAGNDLLYVPVEQMDIVQKYIGMDSASPRLNTLSGCEWKMAKAKAKAAVSEMAEGLLDLYAKRKIKEGYAFEKDSAWQREFEDSFPYAETEDQLRCIEEIKKDMEKPSAMDRLLCGDVGFGKTEVAARAIFKCVTDGKQAAIDRKSVV